MQRSLLNKYTFSVFSTMLILSTKAFSVTEALDRVSEKAVEIMEKASPKSIIDLFTSNFLTFGKGLLQCLAISIFIIIISSVFSVIKSSFSDSYNLFEIISACVIILISLSPITMCFEKVQEHIEAICGFLISLIPTCVMLHTASGNALSASLMSTATSAVISLIQTISVALIMPLAKASFSVMTANTIFKNQSLAGISSALKSISLWITGLCFTLFTGVLSLQSILQASADNLTVKGLKYGAAKLIPIAGGMISDSMKTVITSVSYIKNVTGISGIIVIIYTIVPPLCFILATKLYLAILSVTAKIGDISYASDYFKSVNGIINILLSMLLSCSVCLTIILAIFIKSTVSI